MPTIAEAGVPGYESHSWYGFAVPAHTPKPIVVRLNHALVQVLNRPDVSAVLLKTGLETWTSTPEAFSAYLKSEHEKWGRVIREAGITSH
jgi:tripartite-type tricarboxylate transporter receptor subunit TctC